MKTDGDNDYADCKVRVIVEDDYTKQFGIIRGGEYPAMTNYTSTKKLKNYSVYAPQSYKRFYFSPHEVEVIKKYK